MARAAVRLLVVAALVATTGAGVPSLRPAPDDSGFADVDPAVAPDDAVEIDTSAAEQRAAGRVLLRVGPGVSIDDVLAEVGIDPAAVTHRLGADGIALLADEAQAAALAGHPGVVDVTPDQVVTAVEEAPPNVVRVGAPAAHAEGFDGRRANGSAVRVAIADTGIDAAHPDLAGNVDAALGIDCTGSGGTNDGHGHGTHVAGTVAAVADGVGVLGVAPRARVVPVKVLDSRGSGTWAEVACGLYHVLALVRDADPSNDIHVVNMSLGGGGGNPATCAGNVLRAVICDLTVAGVAVVVAAGNGSQDAASFIPAAFPEAITVSALDDRTDAMAHFTNYGEGIDVTAPGVAVLSTYPGGGHRTMSGTSMASPAVAGALAVLSGAAPELTLTEMVDVLGATGECPDGSVAESDRCLGQGAWAGDRDRIAEPLVDVEALALAVATGDRIVAPRRGASVGALTTIVVRVDDEAPVPDAVEVRIDEQEWVPAVRDEASGRFRRSWDTRQVTDGSHRIEAAFVRGEERTVADTVVLVRNAPTVTIESPARSTTVGGRVDVVAAAFDADDQGPDLDVVLEAPGAGGVVEVPLRWDPAVHRYLGSWDSATGGDGARSLLVRATDRSGADGTATVAVTVENAPVVTITAPGSSATVGGDVALAVQATSQVVPLANLRVTWQVGARTGVLTLTPQGTFAGTIDTRSMLDGWVSVTVRATDPAGRTRTATRTFNVSNRPTVSLVSTNVGGVASLAVQASSRVHPSEALVVTATVFGQQVPLAWDEGTVHRGGPVDTRAWPDGPSSVRLEAVDPDGRSRVVYATVWVRNGPVASVVAPPAFSSVGARVPLEVQVTDADDPAASVAVTVTVDGITSSLAYDAGTGRHGAQLDATAWPMGTTVLDITATDPAGRTHSITHWLLVDNTPVITVVAPTPAERVAGEMPLVVAASDRITESSALAVRVTPPSGPSVTLIHDPASGLFAGRWDSTTIGDGPARLAVTVETPDGRQASTFVVVEVANLPVIVIHEPWSWPEVGGVIDLRATITRADGGAGGLVTRWRIDDGSFRPLPPSDAAGNYLTRIDTTRLPHGPHTLTVNARDEVTGLERTMSQQVPVHHGVDFGIGLTAPMGTAPVRVTGAVLVAASAWGGRLAVYRGNPLSGWYRVDGGAWVAMASSGDGRITAAWDTRFVSEGLHTIEVTATDWNGGIANVLTDVEVEHPPATPLSVRILGPVTGPTGAAGIARVAATLSGGALDTDVAHAASAWYRIDNGPWIVLQRAGFEFVGNWNTGTVRAGSRRVEVAATDWVGGVASAVRFVTVRRAWAPLQLEVLGPNSTDQPVDWVEVVVRMTSSNRPPTGIVVWYQMGQGQWTPLTLGVDGLHRVWVDVGRYRGFNAGISLRATDFVGNVVDGYVGFVVAP